MPTQQQKDLFAMFKLIQETFPFKREDRLALYRTASNLYEKAKKAGKS